MRVLYDALVSVVVWLFLVPATLVRMALGRAKRRELEQRLGRLKRGPRTARRRLLVHAVSVGEMAAAGALLGKVLETDPDLSVILTSGNRDGLSAGERLRARHPRVEAVAWLPWDRAGALRRWLRVVQPCAVIVVETEIWPNLFLVCASAGIPLAIASGRMRRGDVARYRLAGPLMRRVLESAAWIGAQDEIEAERFVAIGAPRDRVHVAGNLKSGGLEAPPLPVGPLERRLRTDELLLVAGSTHPPEEKWLTTAAARLRPEFPGLRLVLAPRHVSRARSVARLAAAASLRPALWTGADASGPWDALVMDEMGWLPSLYRYAAVVVLGGTFTPHGGHNPFEPASCGAPILAGTFTDNFREPVRLLEQAGALRRADGPASLEQALGELLRDPARRRSMAQAARLVSRRARADSSADRHAEALSRMLGAAPAGPRERLQSGRNATVI